MADTIGAWLGRWVALVIAWPKLTTLVSLVATVLAGWYAAGHLGVNTDTANMISSTLPWRQHFNEFREAFPVRDRNLLIVIDADSPAAADAFATALLAELRRSPELYHSILLQGEGEFFERNGLLYLPTRRARDARRPARRERNRCSGCCRRASTAPPCSTWRRAR